MYIFSSFCNSIREYTKYITYMQLHCIYVRALAYSLYCNILLQRVCSKEKMNRKDTFDFLRHSGLRMTKIKTEIVDLFLGGGCGLSVRDIMKELPSTPDVSTVYRSLDSLVDKGFLRHSVGAEGVVQYRCTSTFYPDHGHFCCVNCGGTISVKRKLPDTFLDLLEKEYGVSVKSADFLLEGKCLKCRNI